MSAPLAERVAELRALLGQLWCSLHGGHDLDCQYSHRCQGDHHCRNCGWPRPDRIKAAQ